MKSYLTYRLNSKQITSEIEAVVDAYLLSAKNVRNSVIFIVNNILSAYVYNIETKQYMLKDKLHTNQTEMISFINRSIREFNKKRDVDKQYQLFDIQISSRTQRQLLDKSLIEQTLKLVESFKKVHLRSFTNTHSYVAQMILQKTVDSYKFYHKAMMTWYANPKVFTGKPQAPSYSERNDRSTVELNIARLTKDGFLIRVLDKYKLFRKFPDKNPLLKEEINVFNQLNFRNLIEEDLSKRKLQGKPVAIRFVSIPNKKKSIKIEYIVELDIVTKGACALVEKINPKFFELKAEDQVKLITNHYAKKALPFAMGIDLGYSNFATLSYCTDTKEENRVISAKEFVRRINDLDAKIDGLKSILDKSIPERQTLITRRLNKEVLNKAELLQLQTWNKQVYKDDTVLKLQKLKTQVAQDWIHKLSKSIISEAQKHNIQFIIVGKNKFWKQELNLGKTTNRLGYNLPHSRLIELLRYKAMLAGIVLLETEESYTSKTSFVTNETLKQYASEADGKTTNSQLHGTRTKHIFKIGTRKYHADVNGAFNIIRKVFGKFAYNPLRVSLSYVLSELKMYGKRYFYDFNRSLYGAMANPSATTMQVVKL